ncbi:MAG: hypothetical protein Q9225_005633 [Loekoesia sp. 1 TL-2023]
MSVSNAASPASAASPPLLAPLMSSTTNKPLAPSPTALSSPSIFTHKEWVIPPRPKPGRKPAADTPPTKRKAQNRQAQRAFRERRAARVGELEEQMKKMEEEDAREQSDLRAQISQLEADLHSHNQLLLSWRQRIQELETTIREERKLREVAEREANILRNGQEHGTDAVPLPPRNSSQQKPLSVVEDPINNTESTDPYRDVSLGCGKCSSDTRCECIEQAFDINNIAANSSEAPSKRPPSPLTSEDNKRLHQNVTQETQSNEMDFTTHFSSKKPANLTTSTSSASLPAAAASPNPDPCGFCQDGTPCICAEMALEAVKSESRPNNNENHHSSSSAPSSNPCINGPGTCAQCLSDANSTLFCKSLAAARPGYRPSQPPAPESMNENAKEDLPLTPASNTEFPTVEANNNNNNNNRQAITGLTLSCADAYETLSRHPAFEQASQELSTWMPQLATVPGGKERTAFEVEAASVMGVLRFFDRRFGKKERGS